MVFLEKNNHQSLINNFHYKETDVELTSLKEKKNEENKEKNRDSGFIVGNDGRGNWVILQAVSLKSRLKRTAQLNS